MRNTEVFVRSPWLLAAMIPACLLVIAAYRLMRRGEGDRAVERPALLLRLVEVVLLVLIAAGAGLVTHSQETVSVLLVDRSASMQGAAQQADAIVGEAQSLAGPEDRIELLYFAEAPSDEEGGLSGGATDIAAAIDAAAQRLTQQAARRIVLVSDGGATDGDAAAAARRAHAQGIRVDAVHVDTRMTAPEMQMTDFSLPSDAAQGQRFAAQVCVRSNAGMQGTLVIFDGERRIWEEAVTVLEGENRYAVNLTAGEAGEHTYRAQMECAEDTVAQNNQRFALMSVNSGARILLVDGTGAEAEKLSALLEEGGFSVDTVASAQLPDTVSALCDYGLIVLMNVNETDLPEGSAQRLEEYVSDYGRSVLTTGGENTYIYGGMKDTPFEEFLPVRMSVAEKESVDPVALMLVIDVTDSMTRQSVGVPIEMARRGAIKCVDALNANDYAGVITFADDAQVLVEMTSMESKEAVIEAINGIDTADPDRLTKFSGALTLAGETLKAFDGLEKKHVIFITDGSPADAKDGFDSIVKDMRANGITMSTIAVGRIMNVVKLLDGLSAIGGGRCYFVEGASDLPDIMSTDTVLSQVEYTIDDPVTPRIGTRVFAIDDESAVTQLYGYIRTAAKGSASVALSTPEGRPLFAQWNYDAGRAASFMSDLSGDWSRTWFNSDKGRAMILNMMKALVPDTLRQTGMDVRMAPGSARGMLSVLEETEGVYQVMAQVVSPEGRTYETELLPAEENRFAGETPLDGAGRYSVTLTALDGQGNALGAKETAFAHSWPGEYSMEAGERGAVTLMEISGAAGGTVVSDAKALMAIDLGETPIEYDIQLPMAIAVLACLMADIVIRKTKLKRLRRRFSKQKTE
ncbi:MAG: VWA domain-containing protein [Clostridia bacterium]|nr:VWA domain-containing protein [Clostridia bacterium]